MGFLDVFNIFNKKNSEEEFEQTIGEYDDYLLTALSPDHIEEHNSFVKLGSNFTRTLVVMDFVTVLSQEDIQELSELPYNVSITYHFDRLNNGEIRANMAKAIKQARIKQTDPNLDEASKEEALLQSNDARAVIQDLATGSESMFNGHMLIHITATSEKELERLTQTVKSVVGPVGIAYAASKKAFDAYESFLPLGKNKVNQLSYRTMNSEAVSYFFPFHENEMFDEEGEFVGVNGKTKNVTLVNKNKLLNKHKFYIGISGTGKSTALFSDICKNWMNGDKIRVNDPKGEFGPVFKEMGGEWIKFSMNGGSVINPFDLPKKKYEVQLDDQEDEFEDSVNPIYGKIPSLLVMFKLMYPSLDDLQSNILSGLIEKTYKKKQIFHDSNFQKLTYEDYPTLSHFDEVLKETKENDPDRYSHIKEFHLAIEIYISGIYHNLFNGYTNVDVNTDLVAYDSLDFQQIESVQRILYYNIMSHITYDAINGNGDPMTVVFDEAHVIADPKIPVAMQQLFFMMKVLRSFNVGVYPATQSVKDLMSAKDDKRNYGEAVINQAVQKLYLPMHEYEIKYLEDELSHTFSEKEKSILTVREGDKKEQAGKGILFVGSSKVQCHVELTDMEKSLWFEKKSIKDITV